MSHPNRRHNQRYRVAVSAEVEIAGETVSAQTRDISRGGVALLTRDPLDEGAELDITLLLTQDGIEDPNEDPFATRASVIWAAPSDEGTCIAGLRFGELAEDQQAHLQRFLDAVSQEG